MKKDIKLINSLRLILTWIAYIIIFWTLYNINVILFTFCLAMFITLKVFKINIMCRLFGHIESTKPKHGIIRCKRCNHPIYRIK